MSPPVILLCIAGYFCFLLLIAWYTSRKATSESYFLGNRASPWYAVALGLVGDSLSGVTFISVPGQVGTFQFSYLQIVLGYVVGYVVIAELLLPLFYRLRLTSIYGYLRSRLGPNSQKTGSFFFIASRMVGAAARLYLAASILQAFVFQGWKVPFAVTVSTIIALMLVYTFKGGIRTLVWTDTFQSCFLIGGLVLSIAAIARELHLDLPALTRAVWSSDLSRTFFWDWHHPKFFGREFISGIFIAIVMSGLDQNMMQKNLSCPNLRDAQKNIYAFSVVMVAVNVLFLSLGALLYLYAAARGVEIPANRDHLFPLLALQSFGAFAALVFILGFTAATFSSADSVLTTLTTSFCLDLLEMENRPWSEARRVRTRHWTHLGFAVVLLLAILAFQAWNRQAVIQTVLKLAGYTYGPLLGLFGFGLFTRLGVRDRWVPALCLLPPVACYFLDRHGEAWLGYVFGNELLIVNGLLTFLLLLAARPAMTPARRA